MTFVAPERASRKPRNEGVPGPVRTKAHPRATGLVSIDTVLRSPDVREDSPSGFARMREIVNRPFGKSAKMLKKEVGWKNLKFVFPAALEHGDTVYFVRWVWYLNQFVERDGGIYILWRKDFRTVHEN